MRYASLAICFVNTLLFVVSYCRDCINAFFFSKTILCAYLGKNSFAINVCGFSRLHKAQTILNNGFHLLLGVSNGRVSMLLSSHVLDQIVNMAL